MMLSRFESGTVDGDGDSKSHQLLRDIEAISKALYLQKPPHRALISPSSARSKSVERPRLSQSKPSLNNRVIDESVSSKDKKWSWKKPLQALSHVLHQKFNVCFFLHVHSIDGLPPNFNDISLSVHWKRKDEVLQTRPSTVLKGIAQFDEILMHKCSVYGSRSGTQNSAKYKAKLFTIDACVVGAQGVDLGKKWVDLTRLLPLTLEELEGEKCTGKWTTSFTLSGRAKGAALHVSFGFLVVRDSLVELGNNINASELINKVRDLRQNNSNGMLRRVGSVPSNLNRGPSLTSQSTNFKIYDEVPPNLSLELSKSISFLYEKLDESTFCKSEELDKPESMHAPKTETSLESKFDKDDDQGTEFIVVEQGIEVSENRTFEPEEGVVSAVASPTIETFEMGEIMTGDDIDLDEEANVLCEEGEIFDSYMSELFMNESKVCDRNNNNCEKGFEMDDLESKLCSLLISESFKLGSPAAVSEFLEPANDIDCEMENEANKIPNRSLSFEKYTETVANDFLNMLGIDFSDPLGHSSESDPESPRGILLRQFEKEAIASGSFIMTNDAGEEQENFDGFASPGFGNDNVCGVFDLSLVVKAAEEGQQRVSNKLLDRRKAKVLEDLETEALMKEWGLNETAFLNSPCYRSDGFGSPIELPSEDPVELPAIGDGFGPIMQMKNGGYLRSMNPSLFRTSKNIRSLIMQSSHPVVLPAVMGTDVMKILQHLAVLGIDKLSLQASEKMPLEDITGKTLHQIAQDAPSAAGISDQCAPSCHESLYEKDAPSLDGLELGQEDYVTLKDLAPLAIDKVEAIMIEGLRIQSNMSAEKASSSIDPQCANLDGLLLFSITLDEWLRLDSGIITDNDDIVKSEDMTKVLVAHHAKCIDFTKKMFSRNHGLLGNNLTVAFMIVLRDPDRDYESVGGPMLALIEVERTIDNQEDSLSWFKINEVHLCGVSAESDKIKLWGTKMQQQSGTRWLQTSGMSKSTTNHLLSKSKAIVLSNPQMRRNPQHDVLWSISAHIDGRENNWKELTGCVPHTRNPDVIFPK